jgi:hypothetical protein
MDTSVSRYFVAALSVCMSACSTFYYNEGTSRVVVQDKAGSQFVGTYVDPSKIGDDKAVIQKGEAFSVRLISAFICDFHEAAWFDLFGRSNDADKPCAGGDGGQGEVTRGEITIVTNLGERTDGAGVSFNPADLNTVGRVVYYNEDVRETGQLINALNLPVFGPETYNGGPFFMDWSILELDNQENSSARGILNSLATIGGTAFPSSSPVLAVLNNVGTVLLKNGKDDIEMRYQFEFDPAFSGITTAVAGVAKESLVFRMPLKEGYFAILRRENRDALPSLKVGDAGGNLSVCKNEGFLCDAGNQPYRGSTWLLLRIAREDNVMAKKFDTANEVADFMQAISKNSKTVDVNVLNAAVKAYKDAQ